MSKKPMQQVARLVWHANYSIKRSFNAVTNAAEKAMPTTQNPNYGGANSLNKNWIHPPDALIYGRVEYTVKLLGDVPAEQAKGTEVIKQAVQKLRFNFSLKKSAGIKLQKVELHISVESVNIVDAKTKMVLHKYPLHRISFCADDKNDKRLFAFIARQQPTAGDGGAERHQCYVFLSDKLAEEITLTIGEAFDLAYRRFLDNNGRDLELKKQLMVLRKRVGELEMENAELKRQLAQQQRNVSASAFQEQPDPLFDLAHDTTTKQNQPQQAAPLTNGATATRTWENFLESSPPPLPSSPIPTRPPANIQPLPPPTFNRSRSAGASNNVDIMRALSANGPDVGRRLENLRLTDMEDIFDEDFDPRAGERSNVNITNPFANNAHLINNGHGTTSAGGEPSTQELETAISMIDSRLAEMRDGYTRGLSFGTDDFHLTDFDPLQTTTPTTTSASTVPNA